MEIAAPEVANNDGVIIMNKILAAALAASCVAFCSSGVAAPITWQFTGAINEGNNGGFFFPFAVVPGDSIAIDLSFDPGTPCSTCTGTLDVYDDPLTALSFTANGVTFAFPLISSSLTLAKNEPAGPNYLNLFDLFYSGSDSNTGIYYQGNLALQSGASMPPVPGINDVDLAKLVLPDPFDFGGTIKPPDNDFFDVTGAQDGGINVFGGVALTSSVVSAPEPSSLSLWAAGIAIALLLGVPRMIVRSRSN